MTNPEKNDIPAQTAGSEADIPALLLPDESLDQLAGGAGSADERSQKLRDLMDEYEKSVNDLNKLSGDDATRFYEDVLNPLRTKMRDMTGTILKN